MSGGRKRRVEEKKAKRLPPPIPSIFYIRRSQIICKKKYSFSITWPTISKFFEDGTVVNFRRYRIKGFSKTIRFLLNRKFKKIKKFGNFIPVSEIVSKKSPPNNKISKINEVYFFRGRSPKNHSIRLSYFIKLLMRKSKFYRSFFTNQVQHLLRPSKKKKI